MDLQYFQQIIASGEPLRGDEMIAFMREQSDNTRRLLFDLNHSYHTPEEIVTLFSRITESEVHDSFRMFPPFYTDFGKNIHVGKMSLSIPAASFRTRVASLSVTVH